MKIAVILCSSRGGSTLVKNLLSLCPGVISLAGEEEPYLRMTRNCYPWNPDDGFKPSWLRNKGRLRRLIDDELTEPCLDHQWARRLQIQFPDRVFPTMSAQTMDNPREFLRSYRIAQHYDGLDEAEVDSIPEGFEDTPLVFPKVCGAGETVLFKAPASAYRPLFYETLFPEVTDVRYIHLTRNPAASISGLIDGWKSNYFFSTQLNDGSWWKFDLYPGWARDQFSGVDVRARSQWVVAHQAILKNYPGVPRIKFENILREPVIWLRRVCEHLDIAVPDARRVRELLAKPVMATRPPRPERWRKKEDIIRPLLKDFDVRALMQEFDYATEASWI